MALGLHLGKLFSHPLNNCKITQSIEGKLPTVRLVPTKTQANKLEHHRLVVAEPHWCGKHRRAILQQVGRDGNTINAAGYLLGGGVPLCTKDCRASISRNLPPRKLLSLGI